MLGSLTVLWVYFWSQTLHTSKPTKLWSKHLFGRSCVFSSVCGAMWSNFVHTAPHTSKPTKIGQIIPQVVYLAGSVVLRGQIPVMLVSSQGTRLGVAQLNSNTNVVTKAVVMPFYPGPVEMQQRTLLPLLPSVTDDHRRVASQHLTHTDQSRSVQTCQPGHTLHLDSGVVSPFSGLRTEMSALHNSGCSAIRGLW